MRDCSGFEQLYMYYSVASFSECEFLRNESEYGFLTESNTNSITFSNCRFDAWETKQLAEQSRTIGGIVFTDKGTPRRYNDIEVSTAEELLEAIQPNTVIRLNIEEPLDLTAYLQEVWDSEGEAWNNAHSYVQIMKCYDGLELLVRDVNNLTLAGSFGDSRESHIYVEPRYADVLRFMNCSGICIRGLTLGHTETGECFGNVLTFENCYSVLLDNLDVYGCGYYGLCFMNNTNGVLINHCLIRDCEAGPLCVENCRGNFTVIDSELTGSERGGAIWNDDNLYMYFLRCKFGPQETGTLRYMENVGFDYCDWSEEGWEYPDFDWDFDFDPDSAEQVPLDTFILTNIYWVGYRLTDTLSEVEQNLPCEDQEGNYVQFSLIFEEDGMGSLYRGEDEAVSMTWTSSDDYSGAIELEDYDKPGSISLWYQSDGDEGAGMYWLFVELEGIQIWFY